MARRKITAEEEVSSLSPRGIGTRAKPVMRAAAVLPPTSTQVTFKELQRLHAMRMELFGFGGWLASALFYVLFLVWAYVPEATLKTYGFTYFPSKHWAVAGPAMLVTTYVFSLVLYKALNLLATPRLKSYATILDTHAVPLPEGSTCFQDDTEGTPAIGDISIFEVNRNLFSHTKYQHLKHD